MSLPPDVVAEFAAGEHKAHLDNLDDACSLINNYVEKQIRHIPEHYFVKVLLPLMRGWLRGDPVEIGIWLNVADGLDRQIVVVDENKKEMFRVPPPFVGVPTRVHVPGEKLVTLGTIVQHQKNLSDNGDKRAAMQIEHELVDICAPRPEDEEKARNILLLVSIYLRYDLPMEEVLGPKAKEILKTITDSSTSEDGGSTTAQPSERVEQSDDNYRF